MRSRRPLEILDDAIEELTGSVIWRWVRFALGARAIGDSPLALERLYTQEALFDYEPRLVGDYLCRVASKRASRRKVNLDWLADRALTGDGPRTHARQLHACRALNSFPSESKSVGRGLQAMAEDASLPGPLRGWAGYVRSNAAGWKPGNTVEYVMDGETTPLVRRGATLSLRRSGASGSHATWSRAVVARDPGLVTAAAWALGTST